MRLHRRISDTGDSDAYRDFGAVRDWPCLADRGLRVWQGLSSSHHDLKAL
jgi:hypothetical protein